MCLTEDGNMTSPMDSNPAKIQIKPDLKLSDETEIVLKPEDLLFVKETILSVCEQKEYNPSPEQKSIKKWTPVDVGRLFFCLW
jgi:hypothetical protein